MKIELQNKLFESDPLYAEMLKDIKEVKAESRLLGIDMLQLV